MRGLWLKSCTWVGARDSPFQDESFVRRWPFSRRSAGAFAFVALQQFVANTSLAGQIPEGGRWPCVGVAFGHLRNTRGLFPRWDGSHANGFIPWMTGTGIFPQVILGMRGIEGEEVYALADAMDRPHFRHSAPLELVACSGTRTVRVEVNNLRLEQSALLKTDPPGAFARNDRQGVLYQTPLMIGCIRACRQLIRASSLVGAAEQARCETATDQRLERTYSAFEGCTPEKGQQLRAELGDFAVRLARLAVMASGGAGLVHGHAAQRLYREALLYSLMAQSNAIVDEAFREVFP